MDLFVSIGIISIIRPPAQTCLRAYTHRQARGQVYWYVYLMKKLFDRAFFNFLLGFIAILAVSFSLLVIFGVYEDFKADLAAAIRTVFVH